MMDSRAMSLVVAGIRDAALPELAACAAVCVSRLKKAGCYEGEEDRYAEVLNGILGTVPIEHAEAAVEWMGSCMHAGDDDTDRDFIIAEAERLMKDVRG